MNWQLILGGANVGLGLAMIAVGLAMLATVLRDNNVED
jgi:hypothetical protein